MVEIKPHIIIQARMGSSRLPSKVMMPINGKPMIGYQIERLLKTELPIILATSDDPNNDKLVAYVKSLGVDIFRGSEDNVLERYYKAAKLNNAKHIIRITGDNPLVDSNFILNQLYAFSPKTNRYYLHKGSNKKLPLGMSFEMFSMELLEEAYIKVQSKSEKEHVTPYMHQNMSDDIKIMNFETEINCPDARLTVDTIEDFELVKILIEVFHCHLKSLEEIIKTLMNNRELLQFNKGIHQRKWDE